VGGWGFFWIFGAVAEDVQLTAIGSTPISGTSHGKEEYVAKTYVPC